MWQISLLTFLVWFQVRIKVLDKNDSPPSFQDMPHEHSVSEDLPAGQVVATLRASDPDTPGPLSYALVSGDEGRFQLDAVTGELRLRDSLDRETKDNYRVQVRASDGVQSAETIITILVSPSLSKAVSLRQCAAHLLMGEDHFLEYAKNFINLTYFSFLFYLRQLTLIFLPKHT